MTLRFQLKDLYIYIICSFLLSAALIPCIIKFCKAYSLYDSVNSRKIHSGNIPRLGGVAFAVSFVVCSLVCLIKNTDISGMNALPILVSGIIIFVFGILDDLLELRAIVKLVVQLVACTIVVSNGFYFRQIFAWVLPVWIGQTVSFMWILGIVNAYNLIDGMDGLCGTLSFFTLVTLGFVLLPTFTEGSIICFILAAAVAGFLVFNLPIKNAKIFMGDAGSQLLGFMIATIPLCRAGAYIEFNKFLILLVLVAFPMIDTIAAIWRRLREHRGIMSPDKQHLHHKLLNFGYTKVQALFLIDAIQVVLCFTVLFSVYLNRRITLVFLIVAYAFMICFFSFIHFSNAALNRKLAAEGKLDSVIK